MNEKSRHRRGPGVAVSAPATPAPEQRRRHRLVRVDLIGYPDRQHPDDVEAVKTAEAVG